MRTAALIALTLLAACNREQTVPTAQENRQLDDVETMLNEAPANLEAVHDFGIGDNQAAPENLVQ